MRIELPWPPKELRANTRTDRRHATDVRQKYKSDCCWVALGGMAREDKPKSKKIHANITFYPPDKQRRDLDNMFISLKYGIDGVAQAIGIDDYHWSFGIQRGEPVKGGLVVMELSELSDGPIVGFVSVRGVVT